MYVFVFMSVLREYYIEFALDGASTIEKSLKKLNKYNYMYIKVQITLTFKVQKNTLIL